MFETEPTSNVREEVNQTCSSFNKANDSSLSTKEYLINLNVESLIDNDFFNDHYSLKKTPEWHQSVSQGDFQKNNSRSSFNPKKLRFYKEVLFDPQPTGDLVSTEDQVVAVSRSSILIWDHKRDNFGSPILIDKKQTLKNCRIKNNSLWTTPFLYDCIHKYDLVNQQLVTVDCSELGWMTDFLPIKDQKIAVGTETGVVFARDFETKSLKIETATECLKKVSMLEEGIDGETIIAGQNPYTGTGQRPVLIDLSGKVLFKFDVNYCSSMLTLKKQKKIIMLSLDGRMHCFSPIFRWPKPDQNQLSFNHEIIDPAEGFLAHMAVDGQEEYLAFSVTVAGRHTIRFMDINNQQILKKQIRIPTTIQKLAIAPDNSLLVKTLNGIDKWR